MVLGGGAANGLLAIGNFATQSIIRAQTGLQGTLLKAGEVLLGTSRAANADGDGGATEANWIKDMASNIGTKFEGTVAPARGHGFRVTISVNNQNINLRLMESGGIRTDPYWRLSVSTKGTVDALGNYSSNNALTHIPLNPKSEPQIVSLIQQLMQGLQK